MKHQERKKSNAYARRYGELVAENVAMKQRIHRLVRGYNRVKEKLRKLEDQNENVVMELAKAKAAHEELSKGYANVCNANMTQGRETDRLRNELAKIQSENVNLKSERSTLVDLLEEKRFHSRQEHRMPSRYGRDGNTFCKENPETVRVDSCACWICEYFCLRLKDRGKIVCKEGQKRKQQDNEVED